MKPPKKDLMAFRGLSDLYEVEPRHGNAVQNQCQGRGFQSWSELRR